MRDELQLRCLGPGAGMFMTGRRATALWVAPLPKALGLNRQQMQWLQRNLHGRRAAFLSKRFVYKD